MKQILKISGLGFCLGFISGGMVGCTNYQSASPEDQEKMHERMEEVLRDSSPREMNDHPKAATLFSTQFSSGNGSNNKKAKNDAGAAEE